MALPQPVIDALCCPLCQQALDAEGGSLRCAARHAFDVARQGYVNLLTGNAAPDNSDTPEMLRAREAFLEAGHYAPLAELLTSPVPSEVGGLVLDAGAGTGYYLRAALDRLPGAVGVAVDVSKHAVRHAVRANRRAGGVVCDLWRRLPVRAGKVSVLLNVFAPRNGAEFRRVLRPDGVLLVLTPTAGHLAEIVRPLELLSVHEHKLARMDAELDPHFERQERFERSFPLELTRDEVHALVGMGPASRHVDAITLRQRIEHLDEPAQATASVTLSVYHPR
ncbi:MAG: 23S rRNA methyltransferase [Pseudonocardiaceae bacterium]|nr:23S rRNA methyltransferase [Pseudonocardiaceae bacterium]